jgi:hypothetical protein
LLQLLLQRSLLIQVALTLLSHRLCSCCLLLLKLAADLLQLPLQPAQETMHTRKMIIASQYGRR